MISNLINHKIEIVTKSNFLEDEISTLSTEVTELEDTILKLKQQLHYKKKVLKSYSLEKKDLTIVFEQCNKITPAICIRLFYFYYSLLLFVISYFVILRTLNNYELACILQYLDLSIVKLVCKYWYDICTCEYVEGRDAPISDYIHVKSLDKLPKIPSSSTYSNYDLYSLRTSGHHTLPQEIIITSSPSRNYNEEKQNGNHFNNSNNEENNENINENKQNKLILHEIQNISSLSDDNHIGKSITILKKKSEIEKYFDDLNRNNRNNNNNNEEEEILSNGINLLHKIEKDKLEIKNKITQWKKHFEKKYNRQPSDEEKVKNIPGLFKQYSIVRIYFIVIVLFCYFNYFIL